MNTGEYQQQLLQQQLQAAQNRALFAQQAAEKGNKTGQLNFQQQQQQILQRANPLMNMMNINPNIFAQYHLQQQMQLQNLQRMLEAQKLFAKSQARQSPAPKRKQNSRKNSRQNVREEVNISEEDKIIPHRRILAINLPANCQTIEQVTSVFHPYGDVTVVRVLKPGKNLPSEIKAWCRKIPDLGRTCCALVDFETARAAKFAVHVLRQREKDVGFRCGLLKRGLEDKIYGEEETTSQNGNHHMIKHSESSSDSGVTSEDANSAASARSTSASEHSDSDIVSSHVESDCEQAPRIISYTKDYLVKFASKNRRVPDGLISLEHILAPETSDEESLITESIRQPRGPKSGSKGFNLRRK